MVALGLPASFAVIRSRINHLLRSTFLSIAFRTFFFVFFLFFAMQLSIFLNRHMFATAFIYWWSRALPIGDRPRGKPLATCAAMVDSSGLDTANGLAYVRSHFTPPQQMLRGGLKWTRTTDLTLIRRVL